MFYHCYFCLFPKVIVSSFPSNLFSKFFLYVFYWVFWNSFFFYRRSHWPLRILLPAILLRLLQFLLLLLILLIIHTLIYLYAPFLCIWNSVYFPLFLWQHSTRFSLFDFPSFTSIPFSSFLFSFLLVSDSNSKCIFFSMRIASSHPNYATQYH